MAKPHLLIVEGVDGAGKTTLCNQLAEQGYRVVHFGYQKEGLFELFLNALKDVKPDEYVVFDRCWLSEPIYGTLMRGAPQFPPSWNRMLERVALSLDAHLVTCLPPEGTIRGNITGRHNKLDDFDLFVLDHLPEFIERYRTVDTSLPGTQYDYTQGELDLERCYGSGVNAGPGAGCWEGATILMIGERENGNVGHGYPFVATTGCSPWLCDQLEAGGVPEAFMYWVNAFDAESRSLDPGFLADLDPSLVVAIGGSAKHWVSSHSHLIHCPIVPVPHPQFWKRFHSKEPYAIVRVLQEWM